MRSTPADGEEVAFVVDDGEDLKLIMAEVVDGRCEDVVLFELFKQSCD